VKRILVVDDDADIRDLLAYRLRRAGYEVIVAVDGVTALEAVDDLTPDVVLIDWMMPRKTGLEVCYELRSRAAFNNTGIFLITANTDAGDRLLALAAGASGCIYKPFKISGIVDCVERYIAGPSTARLVPTSSPPRRSGVGDARPAARVIREATELDLAGRRVWSPLIPNGRAKSCR
jgi:two-component system, OmpR family, phosphate regulon response regulator PhoB